MSYQSEFQEIIRRSAGDANELGVLLDCYEAKSQDVALGIRTAIFWVAVDQHSVFRTELESYRICRYGKEKVRSLAKDPRVQVSSITWRNQTKR